MRYYKAVTPPEPCAQEVFLTNGYESRVLLPATVGGYVQKKCQVLNGLAYMDISGKSYYCRVEKCDPPKDLELW